MGGNIRISGVYKYNEDSKSLEHSVTAQRLDFINTGENNTHNFIYVDSDVSYKFSGQKIEMGNNHFRFEINLAAHNADKPISYGLWRRLIFFLADAFPVWNILSQPNQHFSYVDIVGGWINEKWMDDSVIQSVLVNPQSAHIYEILPNRLPETWSLCPLTTIPTAWSLEECATPRSETVLQGKTEPEHPLFFTPEPPIEAQLVGTVYYYRSDRKAFLFMRFVQPHLHRGEDYDPIPYYGYVNERCAFTISAHMAYGVFTFSEWTVLDPLFDKNFWPRSHDGGDVVKKRQAFHLSTSLREELFFALNDIANLRCPHTFFMKEREDETLSIYQSGRAPYIPEKRGINFGAYLIKMNNLPFSTHAGMTCVAFDYVYGTKRRLSQKH